MLLGLAWQLNELNSEIDMPPCKQLDTGVKCCWLLLTVFNLKLGGLSTYNQHMVIFGFY